MTRRHIILLIVALISGSLNTLSLSLQNKQKVEQATLSKHFYHPYMQIAMRYVSYCLSFVLYCVARRGNDHSTPKQSVEGVIKPSKWIFIIPAVIDYIAMICSYIALNFISSSIFQMLHGGTVLTTFLFSFIILKSKPTRQKLIGSGFVLLGLTIAGLINLLLNAETSQQKKQVLIGYVLILVALIGSGLRFVSEQYLLTKYKVAPLQLIGMEGIFGILISLIIIPLLTFSHCPFQMNACVYNSNGDAVWQDPQIYFTEAIGNTLILVAILLLLISMATYNTIGAVISKQINSLARSLVDVSRTIIIWLVGVLVTATLGKQNSSFKWQSLNLWSLIGQGFGFIIMILGNLVFYQIISLTCLKKNKFEQIQQTIIESEATIEK